MTLSPLFLRAQDTIPPYRIVLHYVTPQGQAPTLIDGIVNDSSTITIQVKATTLLRAIYWAKHHYNDDGTQPYINAKYYRYIQNW